MNRPLLRLAIVVLGALLLAACAGSRAYKQGYVAAGANDWDQAVVHFTRALQASPNKPEYRIALERAMINASRVHFSRAVDFERAEDLGAAIAEYRKASEYDAANSLAATRARELEAKLRDQLEAARPKPAIELMRERARRATQEPALNPASREPIPRIQFNNANIRDILNFMGNAAGINVTYERDFRDSPYTVQLDNVTFEEALNQILSANQLFYKVINDRTIMVIQDTTAKRQQYEEQVVRTFYVSHADVQELSQLISQIIRVPNMAVQPMVALNKTANTITVRATAPVIAIIERIIQANDKPRAEIVIDVEILEVNRSRTKQYGLNLNDYSIGVVFSPEQAPDGNQPPFNVNTITQGVSTLDFYGVVPAAFVRFLETDSQTKLIAKPQLRGAEGQKLTLNLGDEIPVPSTTFTPIAGGGAAVNPLTSFAYKPVGVNVEMTPRVTYNNEIILELLVESSTLGQSISVGSPDNLLPTFGSRKVTTKLRLREGESNLLAGLLREDTRKALRGFPGVLRLPIFKQLLSSNDDQISATDIVMLLTPRIIRTHELTQEDLDPLYIGTQSNIGLTGPPPLIAAPPEGEPQGATATPVGTQPSGQPVLPPGSSPVPGTTIMPPAETRTPAATPTPPVAPEPSAPPVEAPEAETGGQIVVTPPGTEFRMGAGPYTVPISITGASQLSAVTVTLTFDATVLRVRSVQEGSFMRQGGVEAAFTQQVDGTAGRIDIGITRTGDATGASGAGLLAAVVFDAVAPGAVTLSSSGTGMSAAARPVTLQFVPVTVTVR